MSPALVSVSVRAFEAGPLLTLGDLSRPWRPASDGVAATVAPWKLPVTRVVTTVMFAATVPAVGLRWVLPGYLWFVAVTVVLSLTDLDRKLIPNRVLYPATIVGVVLLAAGAAADGDLDLIARSGLGGLAYFGFLYVVYLVARGGFGFGDVKLGFFIGLYAAYLAWGALFISAVGAFIIGAGVSLVLLALRIKGRKDPIPFGPYMVAAAYLAILWHEPIRDWYGS